MRNVGNMPVLLIITNFDMGNPAQGYAELIGSPTYQVLRARHNMPAVVNLIAARCAPRTGRGGLTMVLAWPVSPNRRAWTVPFPRHRRQIPLGYVAPLPIVQTCSFDG